MKYNVGLDVCGGQYHRGIDADSPEDAYDKAIERADLGVCHQCADVVDSPQVIGGHVELPNGKVRVFKEGVVRVSKRNRRVLELALKALQGSADASEAIAAIEARLAR